LLSLATPGDAVLPLIQEMARQLRSFGLSFPAFEQLEVARAAGDFGPFRARMYIKENKFQDVEDIRISGVMVNSGDVKTINVHAERVEFTPEQANLAQEASIRAFFDDLRSYCSDSPVVVLLDTYEKSTPQVRTWIQEFFLERFFFDLEQRPQRLVTVIAGQETPAFQQLWSRHMCELVARIVPQLSAWEREHIEAYCRALGLADAKVIKPIYQLVQMGGMTPELITNVIKTMLNQARPR
jgi:hypothetical protein